MADDTLAAGSSRTARLLNRVPWPGSAGVLFWLLVLGAAGLSLYLRAQAPLYIRSNFIIDYELFPKLAASLAEGDWLGAFDARNLLKGPSYPMFIFASYEARIPLVMAEQLLYLFAAAVIAAATGRIGRSRWLGAAVFVALALNPIHLSAVGSELVREVIYTSLSLLLIGSVLLLVSLVPSLSRTRLGWGYLILLVGGAGIGVVGAGYYLCREERSWIVPAVLLSLIAGVWSWRQRVRAISLRSWAALLVVLLASGLVGYVGVNYVVQRNRQVYGAGVVSDIADGQLARAYSIWQSVEAGTRRRHYPITVAMRKAAYAVSPAAAELRPALEGSAKHWAVCKSEACDYLGAFFIWALREAISSAGHLHSEVELQRFSRTLADQIQAGCDTHRLTCGARGISLSPPIRGSDIGPILSSAADATGYLLSFDAATPDRGTGSYGVGWTWAQATKVIPEARNEAVFQAEERSAMTRQRPVSLLQTTYRVLAYPVAVVAFLGLLWELVRPRRSLGRALAIALIAVVVALLARIAVVALVDSLSYAAARNEQYVIPATDLFILMGAVGTWLFGRHFADLLATRRHPSTPATEVDASGPSESAPNEGDEDGSGAASVEIAGPAEAGR